MTAKVVTPEEFKKESAKPGAKARYLVKVGELSTGSDLYIPVLVVRGRKDGPRVFIAAGQQADETASVDAVKRFGALVNPEEVSGTIVVAPLQNPPAWAFRTPLYPLDAPAIGNPFSLPKGDPDGIMTARVLYALVDSIALDADYALDAHATHLDSVNYPFTFVLDTEGESAEVKRKRTELAKQVGYEIIYGWPSQSVGVNGILQSRGCPVVAIQTGEGWRIQEPYSAILLRGIMNFCKATGSLQGEPEMSSLQVEVSDRYEVRVNRGGMLHIKVRPGQYVRKGQLVGEVRDMFDDVIDSLKAPVSGIVVRCSVQPIVSTGGRVCNVFETDRAEEWENRVVPRLEQLIYFPPTGRLSPY